MEVNKSTIDKPTTDISTTNNNPVEIIRASIGSAVLLGLKHLKMNVAPTNCHLLTYNESGCLGNCVFCPQSQYTHEILEKSQGDQDFLSRVTWPSFRLKDVLMGLKKAKENKTFQRICIQSLNYPGFEEDIKYILKQINTVTDIPVSITIPPVEIDYIKTYKILGADRICFAVDTPTQELFNKIKGKEIGGPYKWEEHTRALVNALKIFGKGFVTTHLIVGMGETDYETLTFIHKMKKMGILTGLFAFTPVKNTQFANKSKPNIVKFRKMQLGKFLIDTGRSIPEKWTFDESGELTSYNMTGEQYNDLLKKGFIFQTSGCPGCNRPYYTSSPGEEQYNYPRPLKESEMQKIADELRDFN